MIHAIERASTGLVLCLLATAASAQSFNLDVGDVNSTAGVPAATFGGAASQPGVWNTATSASAIPYSANIVDLSGAATSITTTVVGGATDLTNTGFVLANPDEEALMHDIQNVGGIGAVATWTFDGLTDGTYDVYTYAWAPDVTTFISAVTPAGGAQQMVGGLYPGSLSQGVTHALHTVDVVGGSVSIDVETITSFSSLNGFQFVFGGGSGGGEGLCNGDGGDGMGCTDCPCGNNAMAGTVGGCLNSAGTSTRLLRSGSVSVSAADLRFEASGAPPSNSCVLTSGTALAPANMANPCFGLNSGVTSVNLDGLRCAVQGVLRHGVRPSDVNGDVGVMTNGWGTPNGFFNFAAFVAGDTRHFQIIHRDDAAAVCGTGQNTSQAISATFTM